MARTLESEKTIKYNLGGGGVQHLIESAHKYQTIILITKKAETYKQDSGH